MSFLKNIKTKARPFLSLHLESGVTPLVLSGIPRGGSTWIMEVLGSLKGVRMIAEPFNVRVTKVARETGCENWAELVGTAENEKLANYLLRIQNNQLRFLNPNPFVQRRFVTTRTLYKIIHLPSSKASHLTTAIGGKFVCLLRHPVPVSLSRKVFPILDDFGISRYRDSFLGEQLELADSVIAGGSHIQKGILAWCLHYEPYLRDHPCGEGLPIITYENCVADTEQALKRIKYLLAEKFSPSVRNRALAPSRVLSKSDPKTQSVLKSRADGAERVAHLVGRWQREVSMADLNAAQAILNVFNVSFYRVSDPYPGGPTLRIMDNH